MLMILWDYIYYYSYSLHLLILLLLDINIGLIAYYYSLCSVCVCKGRRRSCLTLDTGDESRRGRGGMTKLRLRPLKFKSLLIVDIGRRFDMNHESRYYNIL
jgi:hypothetical protein